MNVIVTGIPTAAGTESESAPAAGEAETVRRAQSGDPTAFRRLVDRHAESLWRIARALCGDAHEAEDIAVETFAEAWRSLGRFDGRGPLAAWLHGILRHRFQKSRRRTRPLPPGDDAPGERASREPDPCAAAGDRETAARLRTVVAGLPREHRAVIELRFFAGASLGEIAKLLDCPLGTVKSRLHHGLEKLRVAVAAAGTAADEAPPAARGSGANLSVRGGECPPPERKGRP
jgi:RNA polymerase sigma-70 factor (ECF subfamily)